MKSAWFALSLVGAAVSLGTGCLVESDEAGEAESGGAAGTGGRANASGASGTSGASAAGAPSSGGSSAAGSSGSSGKGGNPSAGGATANGGSMGGAAGATAGGSNGNGGNTGSCPNEIPAHKLNDACQVVPTPGSEGDTLTSTCDSSLEEVCGWLDCGEPWSQFDENGCHRTACSDSSACGTGERCIVPLLLGHTECLPSGYTDLSLGSDCECTFGVTGDCGTHGFCLPEADHPPTDDCDLSEKTCDELSLWLSPFELYSLPSKGETTDVEDALIACRTQIETALAACSGEGTAGAGNGGAPPARN